MRIHNASRQNMQLRVRGSTAVYLFCVTHILYRYIEGVHICAGAVLPSLGPVAVEQLSVDGEDAIRKSFERFLTKVTRLSSGRR